MKNIKKIFSGVLIALVLVLGTLSVYAYTGNYTFNIVSAVYGTNTHSLQNVSTSTTVHAESYNYDGDEVSSTKYRYQVELHKSALTKYSTPQMTADGTSYTKSFGIVDSGTYTINVYKNDAGIGRVIGEGTINQ